LIDKMSIIAKIESVEADRSAARITLLGVPDIPGVAAKVFSPLAALGIGVEMIVQNSMRGGITDIAFLVRKERLDEAIAACRGIAGEVEAQGVSFNTEISRVTVAGKDLTEDAGLPSKMFSALAAESVNIEMIVSNALAITCVVSAASAEKAVTVLRGGLLHS
jgi:aspartate kinase